ncbi:hypothetical protein FPV67DRAFT_1468561 [Lyophyllum atratum]|nr:hypothetical protein FPV67DRAFT_1468561 [Lyophyllum atratum]
MQTMSYSFYFMPEIEDAIFECAARTFPRYAPTLSVVSKRIQIRVEYVIYESLRFICDDDSGDLSRTPDLVYIHRFEPTLRARSAEFFTKRVRNVCITLNVPTQIAALILAKCAGVQSLAHLLHPNLGVDAAKMVIPLSFTITSLLTSRLVVSEMADCGVVFPNIWFLGIRIRPTEIPVPALEWLPALTTVQLDVWKEPAVSDQWLRDVITVICSTLQLQSLLLDVNENCVDLVMCEVEGMRDPRILVRDLKHSHNAIKEWRNTWRA